MFDHVTVETHGRVTVDPEIKEKDGKRWASFAIASNLGKDHTAFFSVTAFGMMGDYAAEQLKKGDRVSISGTLDFYLSETGNMLLSVTAEHIFPGVYRTKEGKGYV